MTILLSFFVAIVGLVIYLAFDNSKVNEIGRVMFFTGSLAFLLLFKGGLDIK